MSQPISQFFSEMMAERAWLLGQVNFLLPVAADARKKLGRIMLERYPLHVVTNDNKIPEALKNKAPSKSEPFNDIYSQAYFAVKARWNQWNIWEREWGVLPGTAWPSDFPYAEYERLKIGLFKAVDSDVQEDSVQGADDNGFPPRYLPEPELATNASDGPASSHNEGQDDILKTIFADTEKYLRTTIDDSVTDLGGLFGSGRPDFPTRVNEPDTITVGLFGNKTNLPAKDNKAGTHTDGLFGDVKTNLWTYVGPVDTIAGGFFGSKKNPQTQGGQKNTPARGLFGNGNDDVPKAGHQTFAKPTKN
ncbi:hypothetical protein SCUCBS95973_002318 [Sporothrix curviconia]|uniref:Uncharacterized protein n=1 Tax=Sporothrix curviconia TaxID=1260050 RepID=A0ABP0B618_9PEZI